MFHVKDAEFNSMDVKVCTAAINPGSTAPAFSFTGDGQVDFQRDFLQAHAI